MVRDSDPVREDQGLPQVWNSGFPKNSFFLVIVWVALCLHIPRMLCSPGFVRRSWSKEQLPTYDANHGYGMASWQIGLIVDRLVLISICHHLTTFRKYCAICRIIVLCYYILYYIVLQYVVSCYIIMLLNLHNIYFLCIKI